MKILKVAIPASQMKILKVVIPTSRTKEDKIKILNKVKELPGFVSAVAESEKVINDFSMFPKYYINHWVTCIFDPALTSAKEIRNNLSSGSKPKITTVTGMIK